MRIANISPQAFTYNKEYHDKLHSYLSSRKQNKEIACALMAADAFSLSVEDQLVEMENKSQTRTSKYKELSDMFVDFKNTIAFYFELCFRSQKYSENLIKQYTDEMVSDKPCSEDSWRWRIANDLTSYVVSASGTTPPEKQPETQQKAANGAKTDNASSSEDKKLISDIMEQAVDNYKEKVANDFLELYKPTPSSPRGFCDVAGMEDIKQRLLDEIICYVRYPEQAEIDLKEYGISAPRGFIFYGPPGCGKTFITKALATESHLDMFKMDVSKVGSKYVNQTSKNLQQAFEFLKNYAKKRERPVILFMDEVDSLTMERGKGNSNEDFKSVSTLLKLVEDAKENNIIIIAATNRYDCLDEAFKSRLDGHVYFPCPDSKQIKQLLQLNLSSKEKGKKLAQDEAQIDALSRMLKGYSNRSITFILENAAKAAKRDRRRDITFDDIKNSLEKTEFEKPDERQYKKSAKSRTIGFGQISASALEE